MSFFMFVSFSMICSVLILRFVPKDRSISLLDKNQLNFSSGCSLLKILIRNSDTRFHLPQMLADFFLQS